MKVRDFGFFRELEHGSPEGRSIHEFVRPQAQPDEEKIAAYLAAGVPLFGGSGTFRDVISGSPKPIGAYQLLTDGQWIWPTDLVHYVRTYHVEIPAELVEEMRKNDWVPPVLSEEELLALSREWVLGHSGRA